MNCQQCAHLHKSSADEPCISCPIIEEGEVICTQFEPHEPPDEAA